MQALVDISISWQRPRCRRTFLRKGNSIGCSTYGLGVENPFSTATLLCDNDLETITSASLCPD